MIKLPNNISSAPKFEVPDLASVTIDRTALGASGIATSHVIVELEHYGASNVSNLKAGAFHSTQTQPGNPDYPVISDTIDAAGAKPRTVTIRGNQISISSTNLPEFSGPEKVIADSAANTVSISGSSRMGPFTMYSTPPASLSYGEDPMQITIAGSRAQPISVTDLLRFSAGQAA